MTVIVESDITYLSSKNAEWVPANRQINCEIVLLGGTSLTTPSPQTNHGYSLAGATLILRDTTTYGVNEQQTDLSELFDMNKRYKITITEEDV